jgi:hypothetical protein
MVFLTVGMSLVEKDCVNFGGVDRTEGGEAIEPAASDEVSEKNFMSCDWPRKVAGRLPMAEELSSDDWVEAVEGAPLRL